ncbi:PEP-CTERM sorting domain-containing protein [Paludisphaera mucosa]|uniref:PEP-CTERM sorting domain-containing protein n=1 Tax=Paludisphaera mucosa TaxID=3030827 RepID=A0ABT6FJ45_9BACT|nr:PEP-CTERM sorting domain-containing protein [Paludisphaera mucosa]MDG3007602.1 PEP-CTERM sorting domain-containing protein [Paludisphaera mucosa]
MRKLLWIAAASLAAALGMGRADAGSIVEYSLTGVPGDTVAVNPTLEADHVAGMQLVRGGGLLPNTAGNSFNSRGWNTLATDDYVELGFTVDAGYVATVDQFIVATRSSSTGPGSVDVNVSVDGGAFQTLATFLQVTDTFKNSIVDLGLTVHSSLVLRLMVDMDNPVAARGGAIGATGTFRVSDYLAGGVFSPTRLTGSVSLAPSAVPEPSSVLLLGGGAFGVVALRVRRRAGR